MTLVYYSWFLVEGMMRGRKRAQRQFIAVVDIEARIPKAQPSHIGVSVKAQRNLVGMAPLTLPLDRGEEKEFQTNRI
jgi:hypothetical protein